MSTTPPIRWPEAFDPTRCPVHVVNELTMAARAEEVWARLVRAAEWPTWYPNARRVAFEQGAPPDLAPIRFIHSWQAAAHPRLR